MNIEVRIGRLTERLLDLTALNAAWADQVSINLAGAQLSDAEARYYRLAIKAAPGIIEHIDWLNRRLGGLAQRCLELAAQNVELKRRVEALGAGTELVTISIDGHQFMISSAPITGAALRALIGDGYGQRGLFLSVPHGQVLLVRESDEIYPTEGMRLLTSPRFVPGC